MREAKAKALYPRGRRCPKCHGPVAQLNAGPLCHHCQTGIFLDNTTADEYPIGSISGRPTGGSKTFST